MTEQMDRSSIPRVPSGVPGLDTVLRGGFLRAGVYIVQGAPGAGKTVLGNQIVYNHVASGGKALYVTLLAETHSRMLLHMRNLGFFDPSRIPDAVSYVSGFRSLEDDGLKGLLTLIRREVQAQSATLLVLDGLVTAGHRAESATEFKKFIHELQAQASLIDCTMFLLTSERGEVVSPEHTMVDGLIELRDEVHGAQAERMIIVRKFRGGGFLRGRHAFRITDAGIVVYPRVEALHAHPSLEGGASIKRLSTGIERLDGMIGGGLPEASSTLVVGPSGVGKTTLGLHFLSQCSAAEPGVMFGFFETPERLRAKARATGLAFDRLVEGGQIEVVWQPPTENIVDELGHRLIDAVQRRGAKRLFVDGLGGFEQATWQRDRIPHFFAALTNHFRVMDITTMYTVEARDLFGPELRMPITNISSVAENMIALRFTELRARMHRLISIVKIRDSDYDTRLCEFRITGRGVELAESFESAEAIITGAAHEPNGGQPSGNRSPHDPGT